MRKGWTEESRQKYIATMIERGHWTRGYPRRPRTIFELRDMITGEVKFTGTELQVKTFLGLEPVHTAFLWHLIRDNRTVNGYYVTTVKKN